MEDNSYRIGLEMEEINFQSYHGSPKSSADLQYEEIRIKFMTAAYIVGIIIGVALKLLTILVAWKNSNGRLFALSWLIISLMVAGLIHLLIVLPFEITEIAHPSWEFGEPFCKFYEYQKFVDLYAIAYHLVLISLFLMLEVRCSQFCANLNKTLVVGVTIAISWIIIYLANIPHAFGFGTDSYPRSQKVFCFSKGFHRTETMRQWTVANFVFLYLLPGLLMMSAAVYLWIVSAKQSAAGLIEPVSKPKDYAITVTVISVLFLIIWGFPRFLNLLLTIGAIKAHLKHISRDISDLCLHTVLPVLLCLAFILCLDEYRRYVSRKLCCKKQGTDYVHKSENKDSGVDNLSNENALEKL